MKIIIIAERCPAQKELCQPLVQCCPKAINYIEDMQSPFGGFISIDENKCDLCKICIDLCCGQALIYQ